jgi:hypothetical protein
MARLNVALFALSMILLCLVSPAHAANPVYPGCATPPTTPSGKVHYVDPVHGSNSGDGTAAHPWHTLSEVVAAGLFYNTPVHGQVHINTSAPIQAGDTVYLMSGNHGPVFIQGWYGDHPMTMVGYNNSSFITVAAAPGQTPVLSRLTIDGGAKWVFRGLTIQSLNNSGTYTGGGGSGADYWLVQLVGPHNNIVFDSNKVSSTTAAVAGLWSNSDWLTKRSSGVKDYQGSCVAITNNTIQYIGFGIASQSSTNIYIFGNNINYVADDGVDFGSNNMAIAYNTITNSVEDGDGYHRDGMQGQPVLSTSTVNNVTIQNNTIIRVTDTHLANPGYLQGIDAFDGVWTNVRISNNTVVTDATQGLSLYGVTGAYIAGNILLGDSGKVLPCGGLTFSQCQAATVTYDTSTVPRVVIEPSKTHVPASGVTIAGNYVTGASVDRTTRSANIYNNVCVRTGLSCQVAMPVNGVMISTAIPGTYANNNVITTRTAAQMFVEYDPLDMLYNLTLLP